jgi:hypothetical protein
MLSKAGIPPGSAAVNFLGSSKISFGSSYQLVNRIYKKSGTIAHMHLPKKIFLDKMEADLFYTKWKTNKTAK